MGSQPLSQIPSISTGASDSHTGDILAASTTIAGLAVAILVVFPAVPTFANSTIFDGSFTLLGVSVPHISITYGFPLLLCGICALSSATGTIFRLRQERNIPLLKKNLPTSLGLLFVSLVFFFVTYVCMGIKYVF